MAVFGSAARRLAPVGLLMVGLMFVLGACGASEPERDPIRLQANAVDGGQILVQDLASQDTVLWFWAPW